MVGNSLKYSLKFFLLLFIVSIFSPKQFEAAPHRYILRNNLIEQLIDSVDKKLFIISDLSGKVEKFKEYAHENELEKLNNILISLEGKKNIIEEGLKQIKKYIDTVTSETDLSNQSDKIITNLNIFINELNNKIDEISVFIDKFDHIVQNKKRVLLQINSTSKKLSITQKKLKFIQNKVDVNTLRMQFKYAEKKQKTSKNEYEKNNIELALNYTLKSQSMVDEIYQKIYSIENSHTLKKQITEFLEYTDNLLEYYKNNTFKKASPSLQEKFNKAHYTQKNAYSMVEKNPETAQRIAREARHLILDLNGFYEDLDRSGNDTIVKNQQVSINEYVGKEPSLDKTDILWDISTSGNVFFTEYSNDQYIDTKTNPFPENGKLDLNIREYNISGYLMASLNWFPDIPVIQILKPNITILQSRCNLGNDITLKFFNNLLTVNNIVDGTFLLNQKIKDSSNSVFCEMEFELKKNFSVFSFDITGDLKFEEFVHPRTGYVPYKKYSLNTDFNFNSKDLSKSFLLGLIYSYSDYNHSGISDLSKRDYFFYEPNIKICFWNNTNNLIFDVLYNWQLFKPSQNTADYLNPSQIQNGKLKTCLISQPFHWLNIALSGDLNFENTLIRDKDLNPGISDSTTHLISEENQYLHTYSLSPNFTIKPYSNLGLSLLFEYEHQEFKIVPVIDTLHTLNSYYAIIQGTTLFYESKQSIFQISYNFRMNNITKRGEYNNESNYWELKLPFEWNWNPFKWLSINLETEFYLRKKDERKIKKLKPETLYSISLHCGVQL